MSSWRASYRHAKGVVVIQVVQQTEEGEYNTIQPKDLTKYLIKKTTKSSPLSSY